MQIPAVLLPHTITVRPYLGTGPYGDVHGDPVVIRRTFVEDRRRLVRSTNGEEVVSETTVRTRPRDHGQSVRPPVELVAHRGRARLGSAVAFACAALFRVPVTSTHYV